MHDQLERFTADALLPPATRVTVLGPGLPEPVRRCSDGAARGLPAAAGAFVEVPEGPRSGGVRNGMTYVTRSP